MQCACGCGQEIIPKKSHKRKPVRFISGHNNTGTGLGWRLNHGYRQIIRKKNSWKYEHVLVMEKHIGREIMVGEIVHHINGDKQDNRLDNLELMTISEHMKLHDADKPRDHLGRFIKEEEQWGAI